MMGLAGADLAFFAFAFLAIFILRGNDLPSRAVSHLIRRLGVKVYGDCGFSRPRAKIFLAAGFPGGSRLPPGRVPPADGTYELPIRMPTAKTAAPPTTTWKVDDTSGVSMYLCRT
jgi:hypothetical protein